MRARRPPVSVRATSGVVGAAAIVAAVVAAPTLHAATAVKTTLGSVNAAGTGSGNAGSDAPSISSNGRFVAFQSDATDLTAGGAATQGNVYLRDLKAKKTRLVSGGGVGKGGNSSSSNPSISANGRFVAFESEASDLLRTADSNGNSDVFLFDAKKGTTVIVSVNSAGTSGGNDDSIFPSISGNGLVVAFGSRATDLVSVPAGASTDDVFVRDLKSGTTTLVSVNAAGTAGGNGDSLYAHISPDGGFVAFTSYADDLASNDSGPSTKVFLRDLKGKTTSLVSVNLAGTGSGDAGSGDASVSKGGRFVAFESSATDIGPLKSSTATTDVFVRDMKTGTTRLVSVNMGGTDGGDADSYYPAISSDGRYVLFVSRATDLVPGGGSFKSQIYLRDMKTGKTTLVSMNAAGTGESNGRAGQDGVPSLTANGKFATFDSSASDLVTNDGNGADDVFVRRAR